MAKTIEQLKAQGAQVKNATVVGENTATRVGTLFTDIVEHVEAYETGQTADTDANALAISNEAQARAKADEQLNTAIVAEKERAMEAETTLNDAINTEKERAEAVEKANADNIAKNAQAITDEVARAQEAELANTTAIENEIARAKAAEEAIIFDVSAHNNGAVFESLSALLGDINLSTLIPTSVRHGGMSIRFIQGSEQSSDNIYVQYRLISNSFSIKVKNWLKYGEDGTTIIKAGTDGFSEPVFIDGSGTVAANPEYRATSYIPVVGITLCIVSANMENQYGGGICFFDADLNFISSIYYVQQNPKSTFDNYEYVLDISDIPSGAVYMRVQGGNIEASTAPYVYIETDNYTTALKSATKEQEAHSLIGLIGKTVYKLSDQDFNNYGFINPDGSVSENAQYQYTPLIPISGAVYCKVCANMENPGGGGINFYDNEQHWLGIIYHVEENPESYGKNYEYILDPADIPNGACYIRVQKGPNISTPASVYVVTKSYLRTAELITPNILNGYKRNLAASLATNEYLEIDDTPNTKSHYNIGVSMLIGTMGRIRISKGETLSYRTGNIEIDNTNVYIYDPNSPSTLLETLQHRLTISDLLIVEISVDGKPNTTSTPYNVATLVLRTNDATIYTHEIAWTGCSGNAKVTNLSGSYTNVKISFGGVAFNKDIWIFGDSYTDIWPKYLGEIDATNYMLDGHSGGGSALEYTSLQNALKLGKPKIIIWMLGMNDGDTNDTVNASWNSTFNQLKTLCRMNNITLIPATIPNTPNITNYYKNNKIKSSGLQYIDVADIVGANEIGSSWFSGLLSSDQVHPTTKGGKVIAHFILSQIPQLLAK